MRSVNRIALLGNVGQVPEVRTTASGQKIAKVSLATSERWSGKSGQPEERTDWHRLVCWGPLADVVERHVSKGDRLYIEGSIRYSTSEKDGVTTYWTEINVRELVMLGGASGRSDPQGRPEPVDAPAGIGDPDDDLPF